MVKLNRWLQSAGRIDWVRASDSGSLCRTVAREILPEEVKRSMSSPSRLRVLFVIGTMGGGGAERQVVEILKRIDRARFEPLLYLAMKQGELLGEVPADVPVFAFWDGSPESPTRKCFRRLRLTRILRYFHLARILHLQQIDVVYDRTYLATLDAAGGCLLRPTPRISCCVVDPEPELKLHARLSVAMSWWFARRAYRSAKVVLANSDGLRKRVIEYFRLPPEHVKVFYNLLTSFRRLDATELDQQPEAQSAVKGPADAVEPQTATATSFLIVTAGRLHAQKGHRFLLEAVDELVHRRGRSLSLVILGQGEAESELREFVRTHQLESQVTLAGFVADPREWYRRANLFVLSSLYEGMPNALIEAVACGLPVVSTDCPSGPSEILEGGRCGRLVPPGDALALADGIADAMDHSDEGRALALVAQKRVEDLFDPDVGIHRLEVLLDQIVGREAAKPDNESPGLSVIE